MVETCLYRSTAWYAECYTNHDESIKLSPNQSICLNILVNDRECTQWTFIYFAETLMIVKPHTLVTAVVDFELFCGSTRPIPKPVTRPDLPLTTLP